jgi:TctA family transporter
LAGDLPTALLEALQGLLQLKVLGILLLSAAYGIFVGAVPGLTATMAVALIVPLTVFLDATSALAAIVTLEACAIFAGDIPAALIRIPGTPASAAYTDDAYALVKAGRGSESLGTALFLSVAGGLFGAAILIAGAPLLATVAFQFTTLEYFWLTLLGLSCAVVIAHGSALKGVLALMLGLFFSTVGLGAVHTEPRFTLGRDELIAGISFIPAMIGLFGISEVLRNLFLPLGQLRLAAGADLGATAAVTRTITWRSIFAPAWKAMWRRPGAFLRSSTIGTVVGILPGAGADIAAWLSYGVSKKLARKPGEYGRGSIEGYADATSANNAALGGAWIPALVFGIPGDSVTAIAIGVLLMKNVTPGPAIFEKQAALVYSIYIVFIAANLALLPIGYWAIRAASSIVRMPRQVLLPVIVFFCIVGAYAVNGDPFDIWVMLAMGILGFVLEALGVPLGPVVLGLVLGDRLEETYVQNVAKSGSALGLITGSLARPWAAGLMVLTFLLWLVPLLGPLAGRARRRAARP